MHSWSEATAGLHKHAPCGGNDLPARGHCLPHIPLFGQDSKNHIDFSSSRHFTSAPAWQRLSAHLLGINLQCGSSQPPCYVNIWDSLRTISEQGTCWMSLRVCILFRKYWSNSAERLITYQRGGERAIIRFWQLNHFFLPWGKKRRSFETFFFSSALSHFKKSSKCQHIYLALTSVFERAKYNIQPHLTP